MAFAWWISTGIYSKMKSDVESEYGSKKISWTRPKFHDNIALSFSHILPSIIIYGVATFISVMAFFLEILHYFCQKQKRQRKERGRRTRRQHEGPQRIAWA